MLGEVQVIGLGRVGLPLAATLANAGFQVHGVDVDVDVLAAVMAGRVDESERGLAALVTANLRAGRLHLRTRPVCCAVHVLAVPTPLTPERRADLTALQAAVHDLVPSLRPGDLVVLESTCPPGTAEAVADTIVADVAGVLVATATERGLPGRMLEELLQVPRVVGGVDDASTAAVEAFYRRWVRGPVVATTARVAEVTKLVENAHRDVNVAFANEVDMLCASLGVPSGEVIGFANLHPRVEVLTPGPGVGGHCIPVDPWFLLEGVEAGSGGLIRAARAADNERRAWVVQEVVRRAGSTRVVGCLGLSYKADTDDVRNSGALDVTKRLMRALPGRVRACDPWLVGRVPAAEGDAEAMVRGVDLVVGLVPHRAFEHVPEAAYEGRERFDVCGMWWSGREVAWRDRTPRTVV